MRWESLFADLEAQLEAAGAAALDVEVAEATRHAVGAIDLVQRLRAAAGDVVTLAAGGSLVRGTLAAVGPDWLLVAGAAEVLVPVASVAWVQGLGRAADVREPGRVWQRLGLRSALRGLARDRATVEIGCAVGDPATGTIDRVGSDHFDLALHPVDEPRRAGAVQGVRTVAFASLWSVSRR